MNSIVRTCVVLLLVTTCSSISAQKDSIGYVPRLNMIKVGVTSGILSIVSLNYERVLNPNISVAFTASYMVPLQPSGFFDIHPKNLTVSSDRQITGYYFTPEIKWFLETSDKRPAPRGFYLGGYLRFSDTRYTSSITAVATGDNASGSVNTNLRIDLLEYGVGPTAGYQLLAWHDRLVVDLLFFGPRYSFYQLNVKADLHGDGQLASDLGDALEEALGHSLTKTSIDLSSSGTTTIDRQSLGYRCGVKIGYAF